MKFPDITLQLKNKKGKFTCSYLALRAAQKITIQPMQQIMIPVHTDTEIDTAHGIVEEAPAFARKSELLVSPAVVELSDGKTAVQVTNPLDHVYTVNYGTVIANFKIPTPNQAKNITPITKEQLTVITKHPTEADAVINQLFQEPDVDRDKKWYPTPESCDDPTKLNAIERRIYDEIVKLRKQEQLDPTVDDEQRKTFLANFKNDDTMLQPDEIAQVQDLLVKYHSIFCKTPFRQELTRTLRLS